MVHIVMYIVMLLCANLISSHVQILGCTYTISMSACGVRPLAVAHHLNVKYNASCVSNAHAAQTGGIMGLRCINLGKNGSQQRRTGWSSGLGSGLVEQ